MARVNQLVRVLGIGLLSSLAARLPARAGAVVQILLILIGSLLPLWPLWRGGIELQDLLAYSALWLALSVLTTVIRLRTMPEQDGIVTFFTMHYAIMIGILSLVTGIWSIILLSMAGPSGGWWALLLTAIAMVLANAWSLADNWFTRNGRRGAKLWQVLLPGYLRFVPVLLATIFGAVAIIGDWTASGRLIIGVCLVLVLTLIDVVLAVVAYRRVLVG